MRRDTNIWNILAFRVSRGKCSLCSGFSCLGNRTSIDLLHLSPDPSAGSMDVELRGFLRLICISDVCQYNVGVSLAHFNLLLSADGNFSDFWEVGNFMYSNFLILGIMCHCRAKDGILLYPIFLVFLYSEMMECVKTKI